MEHSETEMIIQRNENEINTSNTEQGRDDKKAKEKNEFHASQFK